MKRLILLLLPISVNAQVNHVPLGVVGRDTIDISNQMTPTGGRAYYQTLPSTFRANDYAAANYADIPGFADGSNLVGKPLDTGLVSIILDNTGKQGVDSLIMLSAAYGVHFAIAPTVPEINRISSQDGTATNYSWDGVDKARLAGWEIGARTFLFGLPKAECAYYIGEAKQSMQAYFTANKMGSNINFVVAANTQYDNANDSVVSEVVPFAFTGGTAANTASTLPYRYGRISLEASTWSQITTAIDNAATNKTYLCFYLHSVSPSPGYPLGPTYARLDSVMQYIISKNLKIVTPSQAISRIKPLLIRESAIKQNFNTIIANKFLTGGQNFLINPGMILNGQGWTFNKTMIDTSGGTASRSNVVNASPTFIAGTTIALDASVKANRAAWIEQTIKTPTITNAKRTMTLSVELKKNDNTSDIPFNKPFVVIQYIDAPSTVLATYSDTLSNNLNIGEYFTLSTCGTIPDAADSIKVIIGTTKYSGSTPASVYFTKPKLEQSFFPTQYNGNATASIIRYFQPQFGTGVAGSTDTIGDMYYNDVVSGVNLMRRLAPGATYTGLSMNTSGIPAWSNDFYVNGTTNIGSRTGLAFFRGGGTSNLIASLNGTTVSKPFTNNLGSSVGTIDMSAANQTLLVDGSTNIPNTILRNTDTSVNKQNIFNLTTGSSISSTTFNYKGQLMRYFYSRPARGQVLIGDDSVFVKSTLTPGYGIGITNGAGSITFVGDSTKFVTPYALSTAINNSTNGVSQTSASVTTTNATPTTIYTAAAISSGQNLVVTVDMTGKQTSTGNTIRGVRTITYKNVGGVYSIVGGNSVDIATTVKDFLTADFDLDLSGSNMIITVTGELATTINWVGKISYYVF